MSQLDPGRFRCIHCGHVTYEADIPQLVAPKGGTICYCPDCETTSFDRLCDVAGCRQPVSCGWPTKTGYRHGCLQHGQGKR